MAEGRVIEPTGQLECGLDHLPGFSRVLPCRLTSVQVPEPSRCHAHQGFSKQRRGVHIPTVRLVHRPHSLGIHAIQLAEVDIRLVRAREASRECLDEPLFHDSCVGSQLSGTSQVLVCLVDRGLCVFGIEELPGLVVVWSGRECYPPKCHGARWVTRRSAFVATYGLFMIERICPQ